MSNPAQSVNAWIFVGEDEPQGTSYKSSNSCYQSLITYGVYNSVDMLIICSVNTVPVGSPPTYTIDLGTNSHPNHYTNQNYMDWIMRDARAANPNIKILIELACGGNEFTQIFSTDNTQWSKEAAAYAQNVLTYLQQNNLDGFDIDWEPSLSSTSKEQTSHVLTALRNAFNTPSKRYLLTLSPSTSDNLDAAVVNQTVDFINVQVYGGASLGEFTGIGVSQSLLGYGARFEICHQDAQNAYQGYLQGGYNFLTNWRLNSDNYQFEQAQQLILYQLAKGIPGTSFDDTPIVGAAGNPPISQMVVYAGDVLNAIQATNLSPTGCEGSQAIYTLPQHGDTSGNQNPVQIPLGDTVAQVSGYTGVWFGWSCVLQITITTRGGKVFGPYGSMNNASSKTPFTYQAPSGQSVLAFKGTIENVPLAQGGPTNIIASLDVTFG